MENKVLMVDDILSRHELAEVKEGLNEWRVVTKEDKNVSLKTQFADQIVHLVTSQNLDEACFGFGNGYYGNAKYVALSGEAVTDKFLDIVWARHYKKPVTMFETKRLLVREITTEDLPALYELYSYPDMTEYVEPLYEYEKELQFTKDYIENMYGFYGYGLWLVFRKEDGRLVGRAGLENRIIDGDTQVELGYVIGRPFWRRRYATECCEAIIEYAFSKDGLALDKLALCTRRDNAPSIGLALKLGFRLYAENVSANMNLYYRSNV